MITENIAAGWLGTVDGPAPVRTSVLATADKVASPSEAQPPANVGAGNPPSASLQKFVKSSPVIPIIVVFAIGAAVVWASSEL